MNAYQTIINHRSIRKFKNKPVEDNILNQIFESGFRASTTGNMQLYSIIVNKEQNLKNKIWELHFKQNMVLEAPIVLTFCADFNRFNKWCRLRKAEPGYNNFLSFFTAAIDALLVAQNIAIAAEHFGLGICYLGTTTYMVDKLIELLECPENVVPVTTLVMGYPDENPELTDRLPSEGIIHYEKYSDYTDEKINEIYQNKESLELTASLIKENNLDNLAQIFTQRRYTKKDNIYFSKILLETLKKQKFMNNDL